MSRNPVMAFTPDGKMVDLSTEQVEQALLSYAPLVLDKWMESIPKDRFVYNNETTEDNPYCLVKADEAVKLVSLALVMGPAFLEDVYRQAYLAQNKECGG